MNKQLNEHYTIPLPPVTKKNSAQVVHVGKKCPVCKRGLSVRLLPSKKYREYEAAALWCLQRKTPIDTPVNVKCLFYMPTALCRSHGQTNAENLTDCAPTLSCNHEQPIVFVSHSQDARYTWQKDTSPACTAQCGTGGNNMPLVAEKALTPWDNQARRIYSEAGSFPALSAREKAGQNQQAVLHKTPLRWIVRRLTPVECERLQGFPDGWTDIGEWTDSKGKRHKPADSPRYKSLGNSIALPQWWWITCKMAPYLPEHATLGSLFDGIGGFPLVWETLHGKGTAVWASEIEEFPIAVTKARFSE